MDQRLQGPPGVLQQAGIAPRTERGGVEVTEAVEQLRAQNQEALQAITRDTRCSIDRMIAAHNIVAFNMQTTGQQAQECGVRTEANLRNMLDQMKRLDKQIDDVKDQMLTQDKMAATLSAMTPTKTAEPEPPLKKSQEASLIEAQVATALRFHREAIEKPVRDPRESAKVQEEAAKKMSAQLEPITTRVTDMVDRLEKRKEEDSACQEKFMEYCAGMGAKTERLLAEKDKQARVYQKCAKATFEQAQLERRTAQNMQKAALDTWHHVQHLLGEMGKDRTTWRSQVEGLTTLCASTQSILAHAQDTLDKQIEDAAMGTARRHREDESRNKMMRSMQEYIDLLETKIAEAQAPKKRSNKASYATKMSNDTSPSAAPMKVTTSTRSRQSRKAEPSNTEPTQERTSDSEPASRHAQEEQEQGLSGETAETFYVGSDEADYEHQSETEQYQSKGEDKNKEQDPAMSASDSWQEVSATEGKGTNPKSS